MELLSSPSKTLWLTKQIRQSTCVSGSLLSVCFFFASTISTCQHFLLLLMFDKWSSLLLPFFPSSFCFFCEGLEGAWPAWPRCYLCLQKRPWASAYTCRRPGRGKAPGGRKRFFLSDLKEVASQKRLFFERFGVLFYTKSEWDELQSFIIGQ